jgi:hypothetical protein
MLEELTKALGPWPLLQVFFGMTVLGTGVYAIVRGARGKSDDINIEDKRAEWAAREQLRNIEENSFKIASSNEKILDAINRLSSVIWNNRQ